MMKKESVLLLSILLLGCIHVTGQADQFPEEIWQKYTYPEDGGFSADQLNELAGELKEQGSAALLIVQNGKVVWSWGDTDRRFRQASIRKSYLNALYGIAVEQDQIELNQTLEDLQIDDQQSLTLQEKQATVLDLLRSRSGVYLPAAYMPADMVKNLPQRGSHRPGEYWYYNNWDFNALATIYLQETGQDIFQTFAEKIADPLEMEDFRLFDTYYRYEKDQSEHPAYLFKMTARDMARFGVLFLNKGRWKDQQIVPASWVEESTRIHTKDLGEHFNNKGNYGLLWWISDGIDGHPMYYASGAGGQRICILPDQDMVVVHLVDTYQNRGVSEEQIESVISRILKAQIAEPDPNGPFQALGTTSNEIPAQKIKKEAVRSFEGTYQHPFIGQLEVRWDDDNLILQTGIGRFHLFPQDDHTFLIEDIGYPLSFEKGEKGKAGSVLDEHRVMQKIVLYY